MSEPLATDEPVEGAPAAYSPPATQADLDRIIADRVARTKNQFKDYAEAKAKAAELDTIKAANQTESERLSQEVTRWQTDAEQWRNAAVGSRVQALASLDFADPTDAVTALSGTNFLDAAGQINEEAIKAELAAVLERKPHWRRTEQGTPTPRIPAPNRAQGTSGGAPATDPAQQFAALIQGQINRP
jgi:hypothetical protein